jgi:uncharacterized protein YecA (UPF0149 family)
VSTIFKINVVSPEAGAPTQAMPKNLSFKGAEEVEQFGAAKAQAGDAAEEKKQEPIINENTVGRNDPCPCGSGKKYKKCCGK